MRTVTRWICCFTGAAAIGICGGLGGMTAADAQQDPPLPPVEEEPAPVPDEPAPPPQEPAPMPEDPPAPQEPAPMPDDPPAPQEPAPMPEEPIAPPEPPAALPEVDTPDTAAVVEGDEETAEVTGDTFDWVLDRVNELLQQQPQMEPPEHEEILDALVDQQVFVADAREQGDIDIPAAEVDAEIDEIRATIPEGFEFEDALAQEGLTEDQFVSMMEDQLHAHAYVDVLEEVERYQDLELTPREEIHDLLSVLMFELDATEYRIMAERVDDVRGEYDIEMNVDLEDVEAPEPQEPALPDLDEPAPMPEPDEPAPMPEPDEPAPMPEPDPAPQPDIPM